MNKRLQCKVMGARSYITRNRSIASRRANTQWGCFAKGTRILLCSGEERAIEDLVDMDTPILARVDGSLGLVSSGCIRREKHSVLRISTDTDVSVDVTDIHPMIRWGRDGREVVRARDLQVGDTIPVVTDIDHAEARAQVTSIERCPYQDMVYNIAMKGGADWKKHCVIANGIVTGDLALQGTMVDAYHQSEGALAALAG